ncbi:RusA family crossover junction endodeoxyribonuclease [Auritidibacter ignavus]|uniref:RusA family crossover junction endodeoxyribonuclease n=1 Tax=Auritidibacter ignavus TaxID=678932 RepID=UPI002448C990|nr:RusA family crossover junction endodeoxyribonuclease [Auritidibacter ignavus]WGH91430.1 RusA family crossover junction endodeoxyribonuclease [Auritidibacter ignavus]
MTPDEILGLPDGYLSLLAQEPSIEFTVPGNPVPKGRPRVTKTGHTYTPERTLNAELAILTAYTKAGGRKHHNKTTRFTVVMIFDLDHRRRVDIDNLQKTVLDGLNKWAWADDTQVTKVHAMKRHVPKGQAKTTITIYQHDPT